MNNQINAIQVENLKVVLPKTETPLFQHVNFTIKKGEAVALTGLSGAGKSIIAKAVAGIIPTYINLPVEGNIAIFENENLSNEERIKQVGYIFQNPDHQLFSSVVEMELAFGPENLCLPVEEIERRITKVLKDVNMEAYRFANPSQLSGGQKQLIAIASVLTLEPEILICDEILSQLDEDSCKLITEILKKLKAQGKTIFMIEHDLSKIDFLDAVYLLNNHNLSKLS